MTRSYSVCVVGAGRWGKNHIRTLSELGALGGVVESDSEVLSSLKLTYPEIQYFSDLESAIDVMEILETATDSLTEDKDEQ